MEYKPVTKVHLQHRDTTPGCDMIGLKNISGGISAKPFRIAGSVPGILLWFLSALLKRICDGFQVSSGGSGCFKISCCSDRVDHPGKFNPAIMIRVMKILYCPDTGMKASGAMNIRKMNNYLTS